MSGILGWDIGGANVKAAWLSNTSDGAGAASSAASFVERLAPKTIVTLGDNFHDGAGPARLEPPRAHLKSGVDRTSSRLSCRRWPTRSRRNRPRRSP